MRLRTVGIILLLGLPLLALKYVDPDAIQKKLAVERQKLDSFNLNGVTIREFDKSGIHIVTIKGTKALVSKDFKSTVIDDIKVVDHRLRPQGVLTARQGIRKIEHKIEKLNFTGNVHLVQGESTSLDTEKLYYYPQGGVVESPVSSTMRTTATTIVGDVLQTSLTTGKGSVRGNVRIERDVDSQALSLNKGQVVKSQAGHGSTGETRHVVITGHYCSFDLKKNYFSVKGNVTVCEKEMKLTCDFIEYDMEKDTCLAKGSVAATDPDVILTCARLRYDVSANIVTISAESSALSTPSASRTSFRVPGEMSTWQLTELHGRKIVHDRNLGVMDAEREVRVVRWTLAGQELKRDFIISSNTLHSEFGVEGRVSPGQKLRSIFRGNVQIVSEDVGASGNKAVFYEHTRNFYVIGNARAWEYTKDRKVTNLISGGKILHDSIRNRNIVIGGVSGLFTGGDN